MSERPWLKWYPADWRADGKLRMCGLAARGLWIELLGYMHEADPYGHLLIHGISPTPQQIASLVGCEVKLVVKELAELEGFGVFSRTDAGVIFSRRMIKDDARVDEATVMATGKWKHAPSTFGPVAAARTRSQRITQARLKGRHTPEEWAFLVQFCGEKCVRCSAGRDARGGLCKDHIIPVYQGGSDAIDNLQPMCAGCNSSKGPDNTDYRPVGWQEALEATKLPPGVHQASRQASHQASIMPGKRLETPAQSLYSKEVSKEVSKKEAASGFSVTPREDDEPPADANPEPVVPRDIRLMPKRSDPEHRWMAIRDCQEVEPDPLTLVPMTYAMRNGWRLKTIVELICQATMIHDEHWRGDWWTVTAWLDDGIDPHETILPVIRSMVSRPGFKGAGRLAYFDARIRETWLNRNVVRFG